MHFSVSMKLTFKQSAFQEVINGKAEGQVLIFTVCMPPLAQF